MTRKLQAKNYKLKTDVPRGPLKLKPTQVHKTKKSYDRKKYKKELQKVIKTA